MDFKDKIVLVTGGSGTLGTAFINRLLGLSPKKIINLSRNETLQAVLLKKYPSIECVLGSIEDRTVLERVIPGVDVIAHLAGAKHVMIAETQPSQSCKINIGGALLISELAIKYGVKEVIGISTDKACDPSTIYGMTKRLMEKIFFEANNAGVTKFFVVRYGNVIGSNSSVVPVWIDSIKKGKPLVVTDPDMTRFYFTVEDAVDLILAALEDGDCSCLYSAKMSAIRLGDLAKIMSKKVGVVVIGNRGREKVTESILNQEEMIRTEEIIVNGQEILKCYPNRLMNLDAKAFTSDTTKILSDDEIVKLLTKIGYPQESYNE